jgi:hypothetical protein
LGGQIIQSTRIYAVAARQARKRRAVTVKVRPRPGSVEGVARAQGWVSCKTKAVICSYTEQSLAGTSRAWSTYTCI